MALKVCLSSFLPLLIAASRCNTVPVSEERQLMFTQSDDAKLDPKVVKALKTLQESHIDFAWWNPADWVKDPKTEWQHARQATKEVIGRPIGRIAEGVMHGVDVIKKRRLAREQDEAAAQRGRNPLIIPTLAATEPDDESMLTQKVDNLGQQVTQLRKQFALKEEELSLKIEDLERASGGLMNRMQDIEKRVAADGEQFSHQLKTDAVKQLIDSQLSEAKQSLEAEMRSEVSKARNETLEEMKNQINALTDQVKKLSEGNGKEVKTDTSISTTQDAVTSSATSVTPEPSTESATEPTAASVATQKTTSTTPKAAPAEDPVVLQHADKFKDFALTPEFLDLLPDALKNLIKRSDLNVDTELDVYNAVFRWINHNTAERKGHLCDLLRQVRLLILPDAKKFLAITTRLDSLVADDKCARDLVDNARAILLGVDEDGAEPATSEREARQPRA